MHCRYKDPHRARVKMLSKQNITCTPQVMGKLAASQGVTQQRSNLQRIWGRTYPLLSSNFLLLPQAVLRTADLLLKLPQKIFLK